MGSVVSRPSTPNLAEAATVTIPTHQIGDLLLIWAFRDGSATNPTVPAGWTSLTNTLDGTTCSVSIGWRIAGSASETSGTWTNATGLIACVFRGAGTPRWANSYGTGTTGATQTWSAVPMSGSASWLVGFVGHRSIDTTTLATAPTGMTNLGSLLGATQDMAVHCSEGVVLNNYATNNTTSGGTNSGAITSIVVINPYFPQFENFKGFRAASEGIVSVNPCGVF